MTKVMFLGDAHGNKRWLESRFYAASIAKADVILQLGDLGVGFPLQENEKPLLYHIEKWADKYDIPFYFVDGNHDNHVEIWNNADVEDNGLHRVSEHVFYIPRGLVFELADTTFLGLGGAYSIDKDWRLAAMKAGSGDLWWPTETINDHNVETALKQAEGKDIDIMVTHEAPWNVFQVLGKEQMGFRLKEKHDMASRQQQQQIYKVVKAVRPRVLLHGHWHHRYNKVLDFYGEGLPVNVIGLGCDADHPHDESMLFAKLPERMEELCV